MRKAAALSIVLAGCAATGPERAGTETPAAIPAPAERASLEIPADLLEEARAALGRPGRPLGYTFEEMANYSGRKHLLRTVETLFRDAATLPRFSGALAESLVKNASKPEEVVRIAFGLTDAVAGRMLPLPDLEDGWGVQGVPAEASPEEVLHLLQEGRVIYLPASGTAGVPPLDEGDLASFRLLPPEAQRLAVRLLLAGRDGDLWLQDAFLRTETHHRGILEPFPGTLGPSLLDSASAPLRDERMGQSATTNTHAFQCLELLDREALAFGSVLLVARVRQALEEYAAAEKHHVPGSFKGVTLDVGGGGLVVHGPGDDVIGEGAGIVLDLGGADRWVGSHGATGASPRRVSLAIDLAGDDSWDGGEEPGSLACGLFGVGIAMDLSGNDSWRCSESGLGAAWFGTGLLVDFAGNDSYETATNRGQGFAFAGVGALVDLAGDDRYVIGHDGQGYGGTLGCGLLLDVSGNDTYLARDDGNVSEMYLGRSVSMAQGVGQGRRADLGDGRSLAGGFGVLVDGAGDDSYRAECWAHGAGYWWAVGILEDLGGNDVYRDGKYSLGAAAHFALGVCVDASGDDAYNAGNDEAVNQYQGHGRDGSLGVFVDGAGDDRYLLRAHCAGSGDLGSFGLFWDRCGDDLYEVAAVRQGEGSGWPDTPPLGSATVSETMRSWRDDLDACGLFLDTGGRDAYEGEPGPWGDGREWRTIRGPRSKGWGRDVERFAPPVRPAPGGAE
ncbi:MAG: hypothetical protein HUU06_07570 [Planctomycetaceae bacterium]|nr:hypothetical protein [Planctomycetaceae bacterium]